MEHRSQYMENMTLLQLRVRANTAQCCSFTVKCLVMFVLLTVENNCSYQALLIGTLLFSHTIQHIHVWLEKPLKFVHVIEDAQHVYHTPKGKIHACFVDLKKAYDSVWHHGLTTTTCFIRTGSFNVS